MKRTVFLVAMGMLAGMLMTTLAYKENVDAQVIQSWSKDKVTAMLFVKPSFGIFVPEQGNSIGVSWTKNQVVPVCIVKPTIGGFEPTEGTAIGNIWSRGDTKAVIFVEPYLGMFVPSGSTMDSPQSIVPVPTIPTPLNTARPASCNPAVETHIVGEFNGWDSETLYKLDNGSIWQQSNYHYHYHYAYHPSVIIYPGRGGTCHIKVIGDDDEGVDIIRIK
jgi:hypothetical protein